MWGKAKKLVYGFNKKNNIANSILEIGKELKANREIEKEKDENKSNKSFEQDESGNEIEEYYEESEDDNEERFFNKIMAFWKNQLLKP